MVKPDGALCNVNCAYCFFRSKAGTQGEKSDTVKNAKEGEMKCI